jgi:hypothetical protein
VAVAAAFRETPAQLGLRDAGQLAGADGLA